MHSGAQVMLVRTARCARSIDTNVQLVTFHGEQSAILSDTAFCSLLQQTALASIEKWLELMTSVTRYLPRTAASPPTAHQAGVQLGVAIASGISQCSSIVDMQDRASTRPACSAHSESAPRSIQPAHAPADTHNTAQALRFILRIPSRLEYLLLYIYSSPHTRGERRCNKVGST
jgi:hypothetical protein